MAPSTSSRRRWVRPRPSESVAEGAPRPPREPRESTERSPEDGGTEAGTPRPHARTLRDTQRASRSGDGISGDGISGDGISGDGIAIGRGPPSTATGGRRLDRLMVSRERARGQPGGGDLEWRGQGGAREVGSPAEPRLYVCRPHRSPRLDATRGRACSACVHAQTTMRTRVCVCEPTVLAAVGGQCSPAPVRPRLPVVWCTE